MSHMSIANTKINQINFQYYVLLAIPTNFLFYLDLNIGVCYNINLEIAELCKKIWIKKGRMCCCDLIHIVCILNYILQHAACYDRNNKKQRF